MWHEMNSRLTNFGLACTQHRLRLQKVMANQAFEFGCSVAFISAVERGKASIPSDYVRKFITWLRLTGIESSELVGLASTEAKVVSIEQFKLEAHRQR